MRPRGMTSYRAALAVVLVVLLGWASVSQADGRGRGFRGHPGGFRGHHGGSHRHHGFHHHGFHHRGFHHHGFHSRAFIGVSPFFAWGPGVVYTPPPVYVYPGAAGYWYYCRSAGAYYPYVAACAEAWVPVPAR